MTTATRAATSYQATIETYVQEPDDVWLLPKNGGYSVHVGVDNKLAIGFIAPIPESEGFWRINRLDCWEQEFATPALAAYALITASRAVAVDAETGEITGEGDA